MLNVKCTKVKNYKGNILTTMNIIFIYLTKKKVIIYVLTFIIVEQFKWMIKLSVGYILFML